MIVHKSKALTSEQEDQFDLLVSMLPDLDNTVITVGGDGTLLHALHQHGRDHAFLPLKAGTVGYLTNRGMAARDLVLEVIEQQLRVYHYNTLELHENNSEIVWGFNEIAFQAANGQSAHIKLILDNHIPLTHQHVSCMGVIVSTSQGSTGLAAGAGGPCVHPLLPVTGITWLAPTRPRPPAIVVPTTTIVDVEFADQTYRPVEAYYDGNSMPLEGDTYQVKQGKQVKLLYLPSHNHLHRMVGKVVR